MPKPSTFKSVFKSKIHKKSSSYYQPNNIRRFDPDKKYVEVENTHKINKCFTKKKDNNSLIFNATSTTNN